MGQLSLGVARRLGAALLALIGAACSDGGAKEGAKAAEGPYASRINASIPKIEKATGLRFKSPPKVESRSKEEVRAFLEKKFNEDSPARELADQERAYKLFGLLPDSLSLRTFLLELLTEQVVGYYDPSTKVLYIVDGAQQEMVDITVAHELVHALQDQHLNLDSIQKIKGDNDRQMAAQAVIEGQATYQQVKNMLGDGDLASKLPGGWDRMRDMIREQNNTMPVFAAAPMLIQETLIFPYLSGAEFIRRFESKRAKESLFQSMPVSTEQVLHENAFFEGQDDPTPITLPAPNGGQSRYENGLGEFETRLFLFQHLQDIGASSRGAAGWDGDRYMLFDTPRGAGLAWITTWDSTIDAGEFFDLLDSAIIKRFRGVKPRNATQTTHVYESRGRTIGITAAQVGDRPVVLYVDVPSGANVNAIDLGKVRLGQ